MPETKVTEVVFGFGHANIQATHPATLEFTKDNYVSKNGDCILVVSVNRGLAELSSKFKEKMKMPHAKLTVTIEVDGVKEQVQARGSRQLTLTHLTEMVVRKSDFVSERTLAVGADKAAIDLSRELVEKLKKPHQKAKITLTVET